MSNAEPQSTMPLPPVTPRPSATVVLVRQGPAAPEVLLVQRHPKTAFGAVYAFPGGVIEPSDRQVRAACAGMSSARADAILDTRCDGLSFFSAAIRELFEETGVLLGKPVPGRSDLDAARDALNAGELTWECYIDSANLTLDCAALRYFGFWITPESEPKRYSTRFFLAALPEGQTAAHCGGELTDSCWRTAIDALDSWRAGELPMIYPTRKTLEQIAPFEAMAPLLDWADGAAARGVSSIQPGRVPT